MGKIHEALQKASPAAQPEDEIEEISEAEAPPLEPPKMAAIGVKTGPPPNTSKAAPSEKKAPMEKMSSFLSQVPPMSSWNDRLRMAIEPSSTVAENFRKLRTKILHPDQGEPPRTVLITSAVSEEGKGFTTANLGYAIAQGMEKSCLAIDCDLRRPTLTRLFGYTIQKGLSQYLNGELADWRKLALPTALEKLSVIASGPSPQNPAELIDSARMQDLLAQIVAEQDDRIILLDSPPMKAAAESTILAKLVDKVVIVVRWNKSGREQVENLIEAIGRDKIIGIVFNAFELNVLDSVLQKKGYYGYYSYYGKGY